MKSFHSKPAFTLVEMLLYASLTSVLMVALTRSMVVLLQNDELTTSRETVQQELRVAMEDIIQSIRRAREVDYQESVFLNSVGTLALLSDDVSENPTVYKLINNKIMVRKSYGTWKNLTNDEIEVTKLHFELLTEGSSPTIRVTIDGVDTFTEGILNREPFTIRNAANIRDLFSQPDPRTIFGQHFYSSASDRPVFSLSSFGGTSSSTSSIPIPSSTSASSILSTSSISPCSSSVGSVASSVSSAASSSVIISSASSSISSGISSSTSSSAAGPGSCCVPVTYVPSWGQEFVPITSDLSVDFSPGSFIDFIVPKSGADNFFKLYKLDGTLVESIAADSAQVTTTGISTVNINLTNDLQVNTTYYVTIGPDAIDDNAGRSYPGISNNSWYFSTGTMSITPAVVTYVPTPGEANVNINQDLTLSFSPGSYVGMMVPQATGDNTFRLYKLDGTLVESIPANSAQVTTNNDDAVYINLTGPLDAGTEYYVLVGADALDDAAGNSYPGISLTTEWTFTTDAGGIGGMGGFGANLLAALASSLPDSSATITSSLPSSASAASSDPCGSSAVSAASSEITYCPENYECSTDLSCSTYPGGIGTSCTAGGAQAVCCGLTTNTCTQYVDGCSEPSNGCNAGLCDYEGDSKGCICGGPISTCCQFESNLQVTFQSTDCSALDGVTVDVVQEVNLDPLQPYPDGWTGSTLYNQGPNKHVVQANLFNNCEENWTVGLRCFFAGYTTLDDAFYMDTNQCSIGANQASGTASITDACGCSGANNIVNFTVVTN